MRGFLDGGVAFLLITLAACGGSPESLPIGEVYEDITGVYRVVVQTATEVDVIEGNEAYRGEYLIQPDGHVRVAVQVLGTSVVRYYQPTESGLLQLTPKGETAGVLYDRDHIAIPREAHFCDVVEQDVASLIAAQNRRKSQLGAFAVADQDANRLWEPTEGLVLQMTGVPSRYFFAVVSHPACSQHYLHHSGATDLQGFANADKAMEAFKSVSSAAEEENQTIAAHRAQIEAERQQRIRESTTPTLVIAEFENVGVLEHSADKLIGSLVLTDVDLTHTYFDNWPGKPTTGTWQTRQTKFLAIDEALPLKNRYRQQSTGVSVSTNGWDVQLWFGNQAERDEFLNKLRGALATWSEKFGDLKSE